MMMMILQHVELHTRSKITNVHCLSILSMCKPKMIDSMHISKKITNSQNEQ